MFIVTLFNDQERINKNGLTRDLAMQLLIKILALLLIPAGMITLFLPIPGAFLILVLGITLLIASSDNSRRIIINLRMKFPRFDRTMQLLEERTGERMGAVLRQTRPLEERLADND